MSAVTTNIAARRTERDALGVLNDRFNHYISRVHAVQEQTKSIENATLNAHTTALDNEIYELRCLYENELENVRSQLNQMTMDKNEYELSAKKHTVLATDLDKRLTGETSCRKKLENALGDAHRMLNEKEASNQELQLTISEHQNAHVDTQTERDRLQAELTNMTNDRDSEASQRKELTAANMALDDQITFLENKHAREAADLMSRISAAEAAIKIAEERLKEHDIIDEALANNLKKVKEQAHADLVRYQEEAEHSYKQSLASMKKQLNGQTDALSKALNEIISLKARLEETRATLKKTESKCATSEEHNKDLIHEMEVERQQTSNTINQLEEKLRESEQSNSTKDRELNQAHNAVIPVDLEIEGLTGLIDSEERRLAVQSTKSAGEIISKTSTQRPLTGPGPVPRSTRPSVRKMFASSADKKKPITPTLPPVLPPPSFGNNPTGYYQRFGPGGAPVHPAMRTPGPMYY